MTEAVVPESEDRVRGSECPSQRTLLAFPKIHVAVARTVGRQHAFGGLPFRTATEENSGIAIGIVNGHPNRRLPSPRRREQERAEVSWEMNLADREGIEVLEFPWETIRIHRILLFRLVAEALVDGEGGRWEIPRQEVDEDGVP